MQFAGGIIQFLDSGFPLTSDDVLGRQFRTPGHACRALHHVTALWQVQQPCYDCNSIIAVPILSLVKTENLP